MGISIAINTTNFQNYQFYSILRDANRPTRKAYKNFTPQAKETRTQSILRITIFRPSTLDRVIFRNFFHLEWEDVEKEWILKKNEQINSIWKLRRLKKIVYTWQYHTERSRERFHSRVDGTRFIYIYIYFFL